MGISRQNYRVDSSGNATNRDDGHWQSGRFAKRRSRRKTGSAEDANQVLPHAWWVCFAPYDKPTIAIAVLVENSGHGSDNAVPIARAILQARFPLPAAPTPEPGAVATVGRRVARR